MYRLSALAAVAIVLSFPFPGNAQEEECVVSSPEEFLDPSTGVTKSPSNRLPSPSVDNDCAFYNAAWQAFMYVTQNTENKTPAFLTYPSPSDLYPRSAPDFPAVSRTLLLSRSMVNLAPRGVKQLTDTVPALGGGFVQAGDLKGILVDRNRNAVYYGIHMNSEFAQFVTANAITKSSLTSSGADATPAELEFSTASYELKSAWQIVEGNIPKDYITARAFVPVLKDSPSGVIEDEGEQPREVTVALLGLHVVGVIDGHPEFIWASFEHARLDVPGHPEGVRDVAPSARLLPDPTNENAPVEIEEVPGVTYALFESGTLPANANIPLGQSQATIDETSQKFGVSTPVYRVFPGSVSLQPLQFESKDEWRQRSSLEDEAVTALNISVGSVFKEAESGHDDPRANYRLVGAVWINTPRAIEIDPSTQKMRSHFQEGLSFQDDVLAGENRMSNMAMESFTQQSEPNCFVCHHTGGKKVQETPALRIPSRRVNVSHIISLIAAGE